jgi:hypothetical protein
LTICPHRTTKIPDVVIAAAAEAGRPAGLSLRRTFDRIAEITGQMVRAIAPLGSLH